jgi:hypothetical protein
VVEGRDQAARAQHLRRLGRSGNRIHPVPGGPGDDRVELPAGRIPGFQRRDLDIDPGPAREPGHPRVGLDAQHQAPRRLELARLDPRPAADIQDAAPRAGGDDPPHQGIGIGRAGTVVAFGVAAERLGHPPVAMRLGCRRLRCGHASTLPKLARSVPQNMACFVA